MRSSLLILVIIFRFSLPQYGQVHLNLGTSVHSSTWSDEVAVSNSLTHQGYAVGLDVVIRDQGLLFMPGLYFQRTSLSPVMAHWQKPYRYLIAIRNIKLPLQVGFYIFKNQLTDLKLHGGVVGTYMMDVDHNDRVLEEDLTPIRTGLIGGATFRVLFLTIHATFENGMGKIFLPGNPSGIRNTSKEKIFSFGIGVYL